MEKYEDSRKKIENNNKQNPWILQTIFSKTEENNYKKNYFKEFKHKE